MGFFNIPVSTYKYRNFEIENFTVLKIANNSINGIKKFRKYL